MSTTPMSARQHLIEEIAIALEEGRTGGDIVDIVIRMGWQPRPIPDPNSDYLEGLLDNGNRVQIEIRHAGYSQVI